MIEIEPGQLAIVENLVQRAEPTDVLGERVLLLGRVDLPAHGVDIAERDHVVELRNRGDRLPEKRDRLRWTPVGDPNLREPREGPVVAGEGRERRLVSGRGGGP